jgi:hypothetical protein
MVAGRLPSKLRPNVLRRKVFAVPGGTSAQLAFVVTCMATAAPRCRAPRLACSNEPLNSLLEVLFCGRPVLAPHEHHGDTPRHSTAMGYSPFPPYDRFRTLTRYRIDISK